jgi:hypothetical protein
MPANTPRPATRIQTLTRAALNELQESGIPNTLYFSVRRKLAEVDEIAENVDARTGRSDPRLRPGGRDYVAKKKRGNP